jgi:hypothetical protein
VVWELVPCRPTDVALSDVSKKGSALETSVNAYQAVRCHIQDDLNLHAAELLIQPTDFPFVSSYRGAGGGQGGVPLFAVWQHTDLSLHCCTVVLLRRCTVVLLACCTVALLYCCTFVLLHCCTVALLGKRLQHKMETLWIDMFSFMNRWAWVTLQRSHPAPDACVDLRCL